MFGFRTPAKKAPETGSHSSTPEETPLESPMKPSNVRRSIGEWESGSRATQAMPSPPNTKTVPAAPLKPKLRPAPSQDGKAAPARRVSTEAVKLPTSNAAGSRLAEARACLNKAKLCLSTSRNLKTDLKEGITAAIDRLYIIIKEAEAELASIQKGKEKEEKGPEKEKQTTTESQNIVKEGKREDSLILEKIEENKVILLENGRRVEELRKMVIENQKEIVEKATYADVVTSEPCLRPTSNESALHSVVVTSTDEMETGEDILEKVRKAVDAKEGWVQVERVRKAKDRKIIMGCKSREERKKVKDRLEAAGQNLVVEEVKNKDPLLVLRDVLLIHSEDELLRALRNQNRNIFHGLDSEDDRVTIKFRKKARNPHNNHIVLSVSPKIWTRATAAGRLRIDLQSVHVWDQTPLIQCTRCLGFGHSKKHCAEHDVLCSHCSGPHLRTECPKQEANEAPVCRNCTIAKLEDCKHNAFSIDCPVRKKWDALARTSIAYC